ncbi:hypothetical protein CAPTEDRAFT_128233 [Capitella teleta]|uniref:Sulfotransferase domain-containing protein n=1 Tax=Capitella teleta TaxID=283909 RepID=R7VEW9_CAPTE|nr:hypothetical protein CAPTEDRAFT_128233 [Capitella teleta]|eukprot:ELU14851.1 hypothetical protein CAPTEDRAFT_128233 [Capitella teleta]
MKKWKVRPSDVLVTTPPESGITWICEILRHMRTHHPEANGSKVSMMPPYVAIAGAFMPSALQYQDKMLPPRIIKTHLQYEFTKEKVEEEGLKVVSVLREPKDTLTSYFHFYRTGMLRFPGDFHQFFELVRQDRLMFGNIFKMSRDWWQARHLPNVLVVKYEEMKKDTAEVVRRVGEFLEIPLDEEAVDNIVELCSMDTMRTAMEVVFTEVGQPGAANKMFRKGIIGGWKNHMTQNEVDFVDECVRKYYDPVGLDFNE